MNYKKNRSLKEYLYAMLEKAQDETSISLKEILEVLSGKGRLLVLVFLSLPFCQPIPLPGLSTLFGLAIAFIGLRLAFGKRIWLPRKMLSKRISSKTFQKIVRKSLLLVNKMERFTRPRSNWLSRWGGLQIINGLAIFFLGFFLALPLPVPLTNLSAAWSVFLICLGCLNNDMTCILVGYLATFLTFLLFLSMIFSVKYFF